jgi:hypothetical protein
MTKPRRTADVDYIRSILEYDPQTGDFYWKSRPVEMFADERALRSWNTSWAGKLAGGPNGAGYRVIPIKRCHILSHRLAWAISFGEWPADIDHIDGNPVNNRIENLRPVAHRENLRNCKLRSDNTSGHCGVSFMPSKNKWRARAYDADGRERHLGLFGAKQDAIIARASANAALGYHENHGRIG